MAAEAPPPSLRLRIDRQALADNWRALDRLSGTAQAGAAVKAQCYGLGIEPCVAVLKEAGARSFFVAHWSEVPALASHVSPDQIAVLHGPVTSAEAAFAKQCGAVPVINSLQQAANWIEAGGGTCHLMVDTGINRLGVSLGELGDPILKRLDIDVLMSHLASADEDSAFNAVQLDAFRSAALQVDHKRLSLANSAGIALGRQYAFDLTRPGIALYGGVPRGELADKIAQVAYIEAAIIQTRMLDAGDKVGYNGAFEAQGPMRVGAVSLGYADGFLRRRGIGGALQYEGRDLPVLGKVSMDMVVVDLTPANDLVAGDWLSVPFHLPDVAQQSAVSQYELLTTIGARLRP